METESKSNVRSEKTTRLLKALRKGTDYIHSNKVILQNEHHVVGLNLELFNPENTKEALIIRIIDDNVVGTHKKTVSKSRTKFRWVNLNNVESAMDKRTDWKTRWEVFFRNKEGALQSFKVKNFPFKTTTRKAKRIEESDAQSEAEKFTGYLKHAREVLDLNDGIVDVNGHPVSGVRIIFTPIHATGEEWEFSEVSGEDSGVGLFHKHGLPHHEVYGFNNIREQLENLLSSGNWEYQWYAFYDDAAKDFTYPDYPFKHLLIKTRKSKQLEEAGLKREIDPEAKRLYKLLEKSIDALEDGYLEVKGRMVRSVSLVFEPHPSMGEKWVFKRRKTRIRYSHQGKIVGEYHVHDSVEWQETLESEGFIVRKISDLLGSRSWDYKWYMWVPEDFDDWAIPEGYLSKLFTRSRQNKKLEESKEKAQKLLRVLDKSEGEELDGGYAQTLRLTHEDRQYFAIDVYGRGLSLGHVTFLVKKVDGWEAVDPEKVGPFEEYADYSSREDLVERLLNDGWKFQWAWVNEDGEDVLSDRPLGSVEKRKSKHLDEGFLKKVTQFFESVEDYSQKISSAKKITQILNTCGEEVEKAYPDLDDPFQVLRCINPDSRRHAVEFYAGGMFFFSVKFSLGDWKPGSKIKAGDYAEFEGLPADRNKEENYWKALQFCLDNDWLHQWVIYDHEDNYDKYVLEKPIQKSIETRKTKKLEESTETRVKRLLQNLRYTERNKVTHNGREVESVILSFDHPDNRYTFTTFYYPQSKSGILQARVSVKEKGRTEPLGGRDAEAELRRVVDAGYQERWTLHYTDNHMEVFGEFPLKAKTRRHRGLDENSGDPEKILRDLWKFHTKVHKDKEVEYEGHSVRDLELRFTKQIDVNIPNYEWAFFVLSNHELVGQKRSQVADPAEPLVGEEAEAKVKELVEDEEWYPYWRLVYWDRPRTSHGEYPFKVKTRKTRTLSEYIHETLTDQLLNKLTEYLGESGDFKLEQRLLSIANEGNHYSFKSLIDVVKNVKSPGKLFPFLWVGRLNGKELGNSFLKSTETTQVTMKAIEDYGYDHFRRFDSPDEKDLIVISGKGENHIVEHFRREFRNVEVSNRGDLLMNEDSTSNSLAVSVDSVS